MNIGLIGTGFMGRAHVLGYAAAEKAFGLPSVTLHSVADATPEAAEKARGAFGFRHATDDWHALVGSPEIDVIDITAPNALHREIALAAIAAGKHVYCEKPLAPLAAEALEMTRAAEAAGVVTQVGFNYLTNPLFALAREMIAAGELGEVYSFRGVHAEDYMADPDAPWSFRHDAAGGGALADIGSHALATAEYLLGPIASVAAHSATLIPRRRDATGVARAVTVDDVTHAMLRFQRGAVGSIEANWLATGRTMQHDFEVYGSRGSLHFSQERFNELHFFDRADKAGRRGFRRIEAGPDHPPYGAFCVAPGHQIGFNDLKAIEVAGFLRAVAGEAPEPFNFRAGWRIQCLVEHIQAAAKQGGWLDIAEREAA
jgi:predicted dehydrogenase